MSGYELSRAWFDWCFENPEKVSPNHTAIYFFALEHQNRLGGKEKFGFPSQMTMEALGIKKHQTYIKYFNDLIEWGFINLIQKSTNQYSANIISINKNANTKNSKATSKALDKAFIKHLAKQTQTNGQSNSSINKQETIEQGNQEQGTILLEKETKDNYLKIDFENFIIFWNKKVETTIIPKIEKLSDKRKKTLRSLFQEFSKEKFAEVLNIALKSDFLTGKTKEGFVLTFDFFSNKNNFIKVMEGNYANKEKSNTETPKIVASTQHYEKPLEPTEEEKIAFRKENGLID